MRKPLLLAALPALLLAAPAAADPAADRLARAVEGRVAGEAVDCIDLRRVRSSEIVVDTAIVYRMNDGTVFVNVPEAGARSLSRWDVPVYRTHLSRLCDIDVVHLYDQGLRFQTGAVFLGSFVPYRRAER